MPLDYSTTMPLEDLDAAYLKDNYLTGLTFYGSDDEPLGDEFFENHLQLALGQLEDTVHVDVVERANVGEKHDYREQDYLAFAFLQLYRMPTRSVSQVRAIYPTGQVIQVFPSEWVRLEQSHSQIQLVPTAGTISQVLIGQGGQFLPFVYGGLPWLPQLWQVDYVSGFDPENVPKIVIQTIAKMAAIEILKIMSDLVTPLGASSQSLSVDGLSQSRTYNIPAFKARIELYNADLYGQPGRGGGLIDQIRATFMGYNLVSI